MKFIELPVRNLWSHRMRSSLTALGIAISLAGMLALVGLSRGVERNSVRFLEDKGTHLLAIEKGSIDTLATTLDEKLAIRLRQAPGVVYVTPGLAEMADLETGQMVLVAGWPLESDFWKRLKVTEGQAPSATEPETVVLGETLARGLGKGPGDSIQLSGRDFKIAGVSKQAGIIDDRSVMIPMLALQQLTGREGKVTGFHLRVAHPEIAGEIDRVRTRLAAVFPGLSFIEASEIGTDTLALRTLRAIAWGSSTIGLVMAFVAVLNTLLMAVMERTREFGLLCAVGWDRMRVVAMVMLEGLLLSAAGAAMGIAGGIGGLHWIASHPKLGGLVQPEVSVELLLEAAAIAMAVGLLGGIYPAWRATRLNPMDLLRSE